MTATTTGWTADLMTADGFVTLPVKSLDFCVGVDGPAVYEALIDWQGATLCVADVGGQLDTDVWIISLNPPA